MRPRLLIAFAMVAALLLLGYLLFPWKNPPEQRAPASVSGILGGKPDPAFLRADTVRAFSFPVDHGPHPGFRTEWWYFTGNLSTETGERFGYQLTFFRLALHPEKVARSSRWGADDLYMAHFAVTDVNGKRFRSAERFSRGALGLAGAETAPFRVWLEDWSARQERSEPFSARLVAKEKDWSVDLSLVTLTAEILNGDHGLSRKSDTPGNASYYYSLPRMQSRGEIEIGGRRHRVSGLSWLDREWSTSALEPDQVGWDWFALQLDDGRSVMFYRLRRRDGSVDPFSSGTLVRPNGAYRHLTREEVELQPLSWWVSPASSARYPARWRMTIPGERLDLEIVPRLADQELNTSFRYWEGAVEVQGKPGSPAGSGYVEMTGYGRDDAERKDDK